MEIKQPSDEQISKEDFVAWKYDKVTQSFFKQVNNEVKEKLLELGSGQTLGNKQPLVDTAKAVGFIAGLNYILDVDLEEQ